ncbi:MAG: sugar phosphate isomerase/epimerase family protein [Bacteroidales bacterium]
MSNRRSFLKLTAAGLATTALAPLTATATATATPTATATATATANSPLSQPASPGPPVPFKLGMAGYTFREFTVDQAIAMMQRVQVDALSLKDFHLPLSCTQEEADAVIGKFKAAGIEVYAPGVVYMKTNEEVDRAFACAQKMKCSMIVGAPNYELIPYAEQKVKETGIRLAIHNHGPDNPLFPNATDIWKHISKLDARMGICLDIGHTTRDGQDPCVDLKKYLSRIFDIHIKDVTQAAKEGTTIEMGRGIINIPAFVKTLLKTGYSGRCSLEFEKDMKDPLAGIAESLGYFRGVVKTLNT